MTYEEWQDKQRFSPVSPEAYHAEQAWNVAVKEAAELAKVHVAALLSGIFSSSEKQAEHIEKVVLGLKTELKGEDDGR